MIPDILIIAPDNDGHALIIQKQIEMIDSSINVFVFDIADFPQKISIQNYFINGEHKTFLVKNKQLVDLNNLTSAWYRRVNVPVISKVIEDEEHQKFANYECEHIIWGTLCALPCFWVNYPIYDRAGTYKIKQLKIAQEVGFKIPDTLVTNDPDEVRKFYSLYPKIIYKQLRGLKNRVVQTQVIGDAEMAQIDSVCLAPVIFQECIEAQYDLRITVIGNDIFPAKAFSQQSKSTLDWRFDLGTPMEETTLPKEINDRIILFMSRMKLAYGAIDMRVTPQGEYVFFEVNPSGQFLFNEARAGLPLAEKFAQLLIRGSV